MFFLAGHAGPRVAITLAFVIVAVEDLFALLAALEGLSFLAALGHSLRFATLTGGEHALEVARPALSRVAHFGTRMRAVVSSFFVANLSAGVRLEVAIVLGVEVFAAVTVVLGNGLIVLIVALGTLPVVDESGLAVQLLVDVVDPLLNALQVHRNAAAGAGPNPILPPDLLRTDDAGLIVVTALTRLQRWRLLLPFSLPVASSVVLLVTCLLPSSV